jgi:hypothetical protein
MNAKTDMPAWLKMIEALRDAPGWAADDLPIEMVQTHISVVLLGRRHALKLKKPVDFGFLDYSTLEKRRRACEAEVSLNRRLCPGIYLKVQPVVEAEGRPQLADTGHVVDYGVLMKRLPGDCMLDRMVARNDVTEKMIDRVAERLVAFHRDARRGPDVDRFGSPETVRRNWYENFTQTAPYVDRTITASEFGLIRSFVTDWLDGNEQLLRKRVRGRLTCDGHGDLRSESICITDGICIFDCIEFSERFRCGDVASEVAFLAMDLDARGRPDLGYYFSECYESRTSDAELFSLLPFYRCYRAFVRGKVLSFRLDQPEFNEAQQRDAVMRARNYFSLARRYASRLKRPTLIAMNGLAGTGKTSVARAIAGELGLRVVSSDKLRKSLFGDSGREVGYGEGPYSAEADRLTYATLIDKGGALLESGGVILDATFQRAANRRAARKMAAELGAKWRLIECQLSPDLIRARLDERVARNEGFSDATWSTYLQQQQKIEPIDEADGAMHLVLNTDPNLSLTARAATDWLRENEQAL